MSTDGCNGNSNETFRVEIESLDCGEDAWACTKAIHITFPNVTVDLIRGSDPILTPNTSDICTKEVGGIYTMVRYEGTYSNDIKKLSLVQSSTKRSAIELGITILIPSIEQSIG